MFKRWVNTRMLGGVIVLGLGLTFSLFQSVKADDPTWASGAITIQKQADFSVVPPSLNGNLACLPDGVTCVINTGYGYANSNSQVKLKNSSSYRDVVSFVDNRAHNLAIPNSTTIMSYTTEPTYGLYFYFTKNFSNSISTISNFGSIRYQINRAPDSKLVDKSGKLLPADYASINFSENGQWMVASDPNVAMLRVNLDTFEILPFGPAYNYTIGLSPSPHTAISNDGRWAAVASKDFDNFLIYDLSSCASPIRNSITGPQPCRSRDLNTLFKQQVPGYVSATNLQFISDDTMSAYVSYKQGTTLKVAKYTITLSQGLVHKLDYLALGDSYISGEGAFDYKAGTDTSDNTCHLSLISYPLLAGRDLNFNSYNSVACSGATIEDIINKSVSYSGQNNGHITRDKYTDSQIITMVTQFQVGYIDQLDFVSNYQPRAVTVSVGGNDIGFSGILKRCLEPDTCYSSYEDRVELVRLINSKFTDLVNTYTIIKNNSAPDTRVYVIGYPQLANPSGDCAVNVHLNTDELQFSKLLISYLNGVIKSAADAAGVSYIDTQSALDGHKLCEAGPGSVAVNGLTAGNDFPSFLGGPIGKESYHPNDFGHELLERYILHFTDNLTKVMPIADPQSAPPAEAGQEILQVPKIGRPINLASYDDNLAPDTVFKSTSFNASFEGSNYSIKPGTSFHAVINSSPITLGVFSADNLGNLGASLTIPASLNPGFHTLHFYGQDINGQKLDIYKVIYVGASSNDFDGDGVPNDKELCQIGETSGQDYDQDKIDDACDSIITTSPIAADKKDSSGDTSQTTLKANVVQPLTPANLQAASQPNKSNSLGPEFGIALGPLPSAFLSSNSNTVSSLLGTHSSLSKDSLATKPSQNNQSGGKVIIGLAAAFSGITGLIYRKIWNN
jgi:hypothetical protein